MFHAFWGCLLARSLCNCRRLSRLVVTMIGLALVGRHSNTPQVGVPAMQAGYGSLLTGQPRWWWILLRWGSVFSPRNAVISRLLDRMIRQAYVYATGPSGMLSFGDSAVWSRSRAFALGPTLEYGFRIFGAAMCFA